MKKIFRLTESELMTMIENSVRKVIKEDVLGNDWRTKEDEDDDIFNNYEPFEDQIIRYKEEDEFRNQHDWSTQGEEEFDPTYYEEDPDQDKDEWYTDLSDGDLYRGV